MPFDTEDFFLKLKPASSLSAYPSKLDVQAPRFAYAKGLKRLLDITLVLLSAPIVVPVVLVMALLVSLDGHSPFYTQLRVGRGNKNFRIIKMRTMVNGASDLLAERLKNDPAIRAEWDATQKLKNDFRITWIGRFLRKSSLDELPQLFNVLRGSMSLVGPRPMLPEQRAMYPGRSYYRMRPGITGLWQISDRNNCDFSDRAVFDTEYERVLSLKTDIKILIGTVGVVAHGTGC